MPEPESGQAVNSDGLQGQATPPEQPGVQPTSPQASFSEAQLQVIREEARRIAQADKDRAVNRIEKTQSEQAAEIQKISELVRKGLTPEQIDDRLFMDRLKAERSGPSPVPPTVGATTPTVTGQTQPVDYIGIYDTLGLDPRDNEVIRLTQAHPEPGALTVQLVGLMQRRKAAPAPSAASVTVPGGGGGPPDTYQRLETKTQEVLKMQRDPSTPAAHLQKATEELAAIRKSLG